MMPRTYTRVEDFEIDCALFGLTVLEDGSGDLQAFAGEDVVGVFCVDEEDGYMESNIMLMHGNQTVH